MLVINYEGCWLHFVEYLALEIFTTDIKITDVCLMPKTTIYNHDSHKHNTFSETKSLVF